MHQLNLINYNSTAQPIDWINKITVEPTTLSYKGNNQLRLGGGHLQGIQLYTYEGRNYAFVTGSTHHFAYLQIIEFSEKENKVIAMHQLSEGDLRHAGGFQIYNDFLAVGLEDNFRKNYSLVNIYKIGDPKTFTPTPLASIERKGKRRRSTAGCVGITKYKDELLLVVGDWNTRHLDFYKSPFPIEENQISFDLSHSIHPKSTDRSQWLDKNWRTYQNINLLTDVTTGNLFMVGFNSWWLKRDIIDLFELSFKDEVKLVKVATRKIKKRKDASFLWGGGIFLYDSTKLGFVSCGFRNFKKGNLSIYR